MSLVCAVDKDLWIETTSHFFILKCAHVVHVSVLCVCHTLLVFVSLVS